MRDRPGAGRKSIRSPGLGWWGVVRRAHVIKLHVKCLQRGSGWSPHPASEVTNFQSLTGRMLWGTKLGLDGFVNKQG